MSRSECYLGLPLHASQGDAQQHRHSDDPNDSDVIGGVHDEGIVLLGKENDSQSGNNPLPYQTTVFSMSFSSHCLIICGPMIPQILVINTDFARRRWGRRGGGGVGTQRTQSHFLTCSRSRTVSAKPTVCMATATAFAKAKISPMEPPSSGPRLREMRK